MKRKLLPPFVMLFAGAVVSVAMYIIGYGLKNMLLVLLLVLIVFYIIGCIIKALLDKFERENEEAAMAEGEVIEKDADSENDTVVQLDSASQQ